LVGSTNFAGKVNTVFALSGEAIGTDADRVDIELVGSAFAAALSILKHYPWGTVNALVLPKVAVVNMAVLSENAGTLALITTAHQIPIANHPLAVLDLTVGLENHGAADLVGTWLALWDQVVGELENRVHFRVYDVTEGDRDYWRLG
jgi:hypothetical protein